MIRRLLSLLVLTVFITSCGNTGKKSTASEGTGETVKVEFSALAANPAEYMGKTIAVEGKVVHVCTHSGKKLFIVGDNPDVRLYIQAGELMPKFPMDLLGSTVEVEGTINKVAASMPQGEGEMKQTGAVSADTCETATALAAQTALADVVMDYKSHIVK